MAYKTNMDQEHNIEAESRRLHRRGHEEVVVYRDYVDVAIATVAMASLSGKFNMVVNPSRSYCVIGAGTYEEGQALRKKVREIKDFAFTN